MSEIDDKTLWRLAAGTIQVLAKVGKTDLHNSPMFFGQDGEQPEKMTIQDLVVKLYERAGVPLVEEGDAKTVDRLSPGYGHLQ